MPDRMSRLRRDLMDLMLVPGLSGHETRVRQAIRARLPDGVSGTTDRLGNLIVTFPGTGPSVMLFTHMDQLGFFVRRIEDNGLIRVERMGGVPERALAAQPVMLCPPGREDVPGLITNKSHHATTPDEKYVVVKTPDLTIDTGHDSKAAVEATGIAIGTPVVYRPQATELGPHRIAGTSVDDRAGCAVLLEIIRALTDRKAHDKNSPTVHVVFSVQEEFNLRGAVVAAQTLTPDIALQIDLMTPSDTPDLSDRAEMALGAGPGISLYSFHGRGTLNGVIPHPALVQLFEDTASAESLTLQRSAQVGVLTDLSYVQLVGAGVASLDIGFPMRYSHSANELCDLRDLDGLTHLILAALDRITPDFSLNRDDYP
ncbi:MAG: M42 family metallopeptidase [Paracoccaceae bacterium]